MDPQEQSLQPAPLNHQPGGAYAIASRKWQGIPGIERAASGRLWATWYSGGKTEGKDNFVVVVTSDDDGQTWSEPVVAVDPPGRVRAYDPVLWIDPSGVLWLFWAQSYDWFDGRCGVWASRKLDPTTSGGHWLEPVRLGDGIMMNKPTVISTGEVLVPAAVWTCEAKGQVDFRESATSGTDANNDASQPFSHVLAMSQLDRPTPTVRWLGRADVPDRTYDEHMIVQRKSGDLWMLVRTTKGIGESISTDGGRTWSPGKATDLGGPNSRFHIRRLASGRLLLINHVGYTGRSHLTAMLSEDDGKTWIGGLLLDERSGVSYPDAIEAGSASGSVSGNASENASGDGAGLIYAIYDRNRRAEMEILMAVFSEKDILAKQCVSTEARLKVVISQGVSASA